MDIKELISKWRYLGYDKKTINKYYRELNKDNLVMLGYTGVVLGAATFIALILVCIYNKNKYKIITCILFLICTAYIIIKYKVFIRNEKNLKNGKINLIIDLYSLLACFFGIFLGVFLSKEYEAVTIIWLFLFLMVIFNRLPIQNVKFILMMILFVLTSFKVKDSSIAVYDMIHSAVIVVIGMFMSWNKTKIKLDYIMARHDLKDKNKKLSYINSIDMLTKLYNRKYIFKKFNKIKNECMNEKKKMCCIVLDIDDFKKYNDTYGHPAGDKLLAKVGCVLKECSNVQNIYIGRIGGEEFMAVWKEKRKLDPEYIAEGIRNSIYNLRINHEASGVSDYVTVSIGLFISAKRNLYKLDPYTIADLALYDAKKLGKNRCFVVRDECDLNDKKVEL